MLECVHHYRIAEVDGINPTSLGICKKCGKEKEFQNYLNPWESVEDPSDILHWMFSNKKDWYGEYIPMRAIKYT